MPVIRKSYLLVHVPLLFYVHCLKSIFLSKYTSPIYPLHCDVGALGHFLFGSDHVHVVLWGNNHKAKARMPINDNEIKPKPRGARDSQCRKVSTYVSMSPP